MYPWIHFANPWICINSLSWILTPKRFDSCLTIQIRIGFVSCITNPYCFQKIRFVDSICTLIFKRFNLFSWIQQILMNPDESWRILSTIAWNKSVRIQAGGLMNPDLRIRTLKIRIADLIRRTFLKRLVSWIRFVIPKFPNNSICFDLEGFVYDSRILTYYLKEDITLVFMNQGF